MAVMAVGGCHFYFHDSLGKTLQKEKARREPPHRGPLLAYTITGSRTYKHIILCAAAFF
jgi:hypothetical protein